MQRTKLRTAAIFVEVERGGCEKVRNIAIKSTQLVMTSDTFEWQDGIVLDRLRELTSLHNAHSRWVNCAIE